MREQSVLSKESDRAREVLVSGELRDLIYFDFDKAASIYSQVEGGLLKEIQESTEGNKTNRAGIQLNFGVVRPGISRDSQERVSALESRVMHHDLFTRLEGSLQEAELLVDVNDEANTQDSDYSDSSLRAMVENPSFITVEGWASIEDYRKFDLFTSNFRDLTDFIRRCATYGIEQTDEYKALRQAVDDANESAKKEKNNQRKAQMKAKAKDLEQQIDSALDEISPVEDVPEWLLQGIRSFTNTFMPNRINLRVYPFEQNPHFEVLSNLKQECFIDSDLENVTFAYGTRPNVRLSVFGMVTSIPNEDETLFDPLASLGGDSGDEDQFAMSFRHMFRSFEDFERLVRFSRYPNITVYPIAVYQKLGSI